MEPISDLPTFTSLVALGGRKLLHRSTIALLNGMTWFCLLISRDLTAVK